MTTQLFSQDGFMPHGHCFLWTPGILWTDVAADSFIALSYYSIPLTLWYFLRRRHDAPFPWLLTLFALFIFACGTTHVIDIVAIWWPLYRLDAAVKAITSVVSVMTAIFLYLKLPQILTFPSRIELESTNSQLRQEVETRVRLESELRMLNKTLEVRIGARTADLEELNANLQAESSERRRAEENIKTLNISLERRVLERTGQLELANQELEKFSYSVAHDLRGPLRAIDGFSQMIVEDCGAMIPAECMRSLDRIQSASHRMARLIDALLDLSRLTRSELSRRPVNVSELARQVLETLAVEQPRDAMITDIQAGLHADVDPNYLRIALENLFNNAWKYTSRTSNARIEFGLIGGASEPATWFVRDNGAGFDMKYADKLFGVFQRLHHDAEFPGVGVGLATVYRIINKHGGRIWAESAVGAGATFFFTLSS